MNDLDPELRERIVEKRFWEQVLVDYDFTDPEFCQDIFAEGADDWLSPEALGLATTTLRDRQWFRNPPGIEGIGSCVQKMRPGVLSSHAVKVVIKKEEYIIELPEVTVQVDTKQYETMLMNASDKETEFLRVFGRCLAYCYRLGLQVGKLATIAMQRMKWKWSTIERLQENAKKFCHLVKTTDEWLAGWFERAAAKCNTMKQIDILVDVYTWAAMHNTRQPRINKVAVADRVGCTRTSIINLFKKLENAGLLVEQPEKFTYDYVAGRPNSEARIINLDSDQVNRWVNYEKLPSPDRSEERRTEKQRKLAVLANNGYWRG
ncbi:hypothetical protein GS433_18845 [Rhodococcus hoagii]|nr:hypothetical protein [Prescottella equi]NKR85494.1 hypothetical protein [Prescottella equi]